MSDANAYMNAYVDNAVGMIHEYIGGILQLKTQLKVCESIIAAKNAELENISNSRNEEMEQILISKESELNDLKNKMVGHGNLGTENVELHQRCNELNQRCIDLQNENNALTQKVGHMDNLLKQVGEMKQDIIARNNMIANMEQKIVALEEKLVLEAEAKAILTEPVAINKKKKIEKSSAQKEDDDF